MTVLPGMTRPMRPGEEPTVAALLEAAFGGPGERRLVEALRSDRAIHGEWVLPARDGVIGHYALSAMPAPEGWLCLAPVAIRPDRQDLGHGRRMMRHLAEWARLAGRFIVVLGQVRFYESAGFRQDRAARLASPYPVEHTLLAGPGQDAPAERLVYPRAFGAI